MQRKSEALRYLNNAEEILKRAPMEGDVYIDIKPIRKVFGIAYLAVLKALDEALMKKGLSEKKLPQSIEAYKTALRKYLSVHDGKLLDRKNVVKDAMVAAKSFIEKIERINLK
jgi:H2-forming N5,N10-methylenetetrahydromethanopterin dehydrogenase-like enzyme